MKTNKKRLLSFLSTLVILTISVFTWLHFTTSVSAAWFNDFWQYRQKLTIGNTGSAASDQKVKFDVDTATLISAGKMQSDCDDVRFTDINGKILPYFLDTANGACNTNSTDLWVLVNSIYSGNTVLYLYYGHPGALIGSQSAQFGQATFSPTSGPTSASEEKGPSPSLYFTFAEGSGNTTQDLTPNNNDGSISGAAWKSADFCHGDNCLYFDGVDDVVTVTSVDTIDLDGKLSSGFTFQAWIKPNSDGESQVGQILNKGALTYMRVTNAGTDGKADLEASLDLASTAATITVANGITLNEWQLVTMSYTNDSDDEITVYINGFGKGSSTNGSGNPASDTNNLLIGGPTTANFKGFIDDFKIYSFERTSAQVATDALSATSSTGVSASVGPDTSTLTNGLVGYWQMDDAGVESEGETSTDSSGNSNTGTLYGDNNVGDNGTGMDCTANGKYGTGCNFDGTDDYIAINDHTSLRPGNTSWSFSFWANPSNTNGIYTVMIKADETWENQVYIGFCGDIYCLTTGQQLVFGIYDTIDTNQRVVITNNDVADGNWHYYTGVADKNTNTAYIYVDGALAATTHSDIGSWPNVNNSGILNIGTAYGYFPYLNRLDEIRLYNRTLSPAEVQNLYQWAPGPIAHYKLDEATGTSVNDSSGNWSSVSWSGTGNHWTTGKFGSAGQFNGTDDRVVVGDISSKLNIKSTEPPDFTYEAWMNATSGITNHAGLQLLGGDGAGHARIMTTTSGCTSDPCFRFQLKASSTSAETNQISYGRWYHVSGVYTQSDHKLTIYLNGVFQNSATAADYDLSGVFGSMALKIGYNQWYFKGGIDDVRVYNYARTPAQIISDMNAGHPSPGSPVGSALLRWSLDEGTDNTCSGAVNDACNSGSGGTTYDGANTGAVRTNSGKFDKAINLDTASDSISAGDVTFTDSLTGMTTSLWLNPQTLSVDDTIVSKSNHSNQNSFLVRTDSIASDELQIFIASSVSDTSNYYTTSNLNLTASAWQHLMFVYDGTAAAANRIAIYKNGSPVSGSVTGTIPTSLTSGSTSNLKLGDSDTTGSEGLLTYVDELKLYNFAFTAAQVLAEANLGSTVVWGALSTDSSGTADWSNARGYCVPGDTTSCNHPVLEWSLEENTGSTAFDTSSNGNNGTLTGGRWNQGCKSGHCFATNGIDAAQDSIHVNDPVSGILDFDNSSDFTAQIWAKVTTGEGAFFSLQTKGGTSTSTAGYALLVSTTTGIPFCNYTDGNGSGIDQATGSTSIVDDKWHLLSCIMDRNGSEVGTAGYHLFVDGRIVGSDTTLTEGSGVTTSDFGIGETSTSVESASLFDQVQVYNYARTPAQIAWDLNRGAPLAQWSFDECSGVTAYDSAVKPDRNSSRFDGTITPGDTSGSNDSVGTCTSGNTDEMWANGTIGKRNASLDFDGTNDYVSLGANAFGNVGEYATVAAWIKTTDSGTILSEFELSVCGDMTFTINSSGVVNWGDGAGNETAGVITVIDGAWHHIAAVNNSTATYIYVDGRLDTTGSDADWRNVCTSQDVRIGTRVSADFLDGQVDEVQVFNYPLNATQMKTLYNQGAVRYGPSTGSP